MEWGTSRGYEIGLDRGVFYPETGPGEVWNGLAAVDESSTDFSGSPVYLDGKRISQRRMLGYFSGNLAAYHYPESFYNNVLIQRRAKKFGLSYRTGTEGNYKIHLVYNVLLTPSTYVYHQSEVEQFRWPFTSQPVEIPGVARSAHLIVDTSIAYLSAIGDLEDVLYGTDETDPRLPSSIEVLSIFEENSILRVTDHGDGTFTIEGPDSAITMLDSTTFEVSWPSVVVLDADTYQISSL